MGVLQNQFHKADDDTFKARYKTFVLEKVTKHCKFIICSGYRRCKVTMTRYYVFQV